MTILFPSPTLLFLLSFLHTIPPLMHTHPLKDLTVILVVTWSMVDKEGTKMDFLIMNSSAISDLECGLERTLLDHDFHFQREGS